MNDADLLPRRLTVAGCRLAGAQLAANVGQLKKDKVKLTVEVDALVHAVAEATSAFDGASGNEAAMIDVDRGADGCIASFAGALDEIAGAFVREDVLPLSDAERNRAAAAQRLTSSLGLASTSFLHATYRNQYVRMTQLVAALATKDNTADIATVGLKLEAARVGRWTDLYGRRLGITTPQETDALATALDAWHEAWGSLLVGVRAKYKDATNSEQMTIRNALLAPYDTQAAAERAGDAKRGKKKGGTPPAAPPVSTPAAGGSAS